MKQVFQKPWSYTVMLDEGSGAYYLDVLCGGAGMCEVRLQLTPEESKEAAGRWETLDGLALQVSRNPGAFSDRLQYL